MFLQVAIVQKSVVCYAILGTLVWYEINASELSVFTYRKRGSSVQWMCGSLFLFVLLSIVEDIVTLYDTTGDINKNTFFRATHYIILQGPMFIYSIVTPKDDYMQAHNMYPELFQRVSIIQYKPFFKGFDPQTERITVIQGQDFGGKPVHGDIDEEP